jgi:hypothetical protein
MTRPSSPSWTLVLSEFSPPLAWQGKSGITPDTDRATPLKIGGEKRLVHPADVTLRLAPEPGMPGVEWQAEVGFFSGWTSAPWQVILGQVGFFDQFTITFSRHGLLLAVEDVESFDRRYETS